MIDKYKSYPIYSAFAYFAQSGIRSKQCTDRLTIVWVGEPSADDRATPLHVLDR